MKKRKQGAEKYEFLRIERRVNGIFYCRKSPFPSTTPHFHGAIELFFCLSGAQEVNVGGESRILQRGDACFVDSYTVHSLTKSTNIILVFLWDKQFFQPILHTFDGKRPPAFFHFENLALLDALYEIAMNSPQNKVLKRETGEGILKILMAEIAKNTPFEKQKYSKQTSLVNEILQYAAENITGDISLQTLAGKFNYSHSHLSRTLHHQLGEHWNRYVGRLRVRMANDLIIKHQELSVLEIALRCGFDSPNTFYRAYRREFGTPPRLKNDNF